MIVVFNALIVILILLIAYWWANQGLFSAILHFLCVVVAGGIALAVWEPITAGLLLSGGGFDKYAWGVTLVGVFLITLIILRVAFDKLIPANVDVPLWANWAFGFPIGLGSGVITVGILLVGCGFVHSHREIFGYIGVARSPQDAQVKRLDTIWIDAPRMMTEFYSWVSATSLSTSTPMRSYYPELDQQWTLVRDSFGDGKGELALPPEAASVQSTCRAPGGTEYRVTMSFEAAAMDYGEQLTLSSAQIRLICEPAMKTAKPLVLHPTAWIQGGLRYAFDDHSHYITSQPGQQTAEITIIFRVPTNETPRFIQVRGSRYSLPAPAACAETAATEPPAANSAATAPPAPVAAGGGSLGEQAQITNSIRPLTLSSNLLTGSLEHVDLYLTEGEGKVSRQADRFIHKFRIKGFYETPGTKMVQVTIERNTPTDIFGPIAQEAGEGAALSLVDASGNTYYALGYMYIDRDDVEIKLVPGVFVKTLDDLPSLPSSGAQTLKLLFSVTKGVTITEFRFGDQTVGTVNLTIP